MEAVVEVNNLKAYYRAFLYGVDREVRAVDDVSLSIGRGEIYGVAGESSSGKTTLIKTIAGAIRPPLRVVSGAVKFHFNNGTQDIYAMTAEQRASLRWRHLSYIMQGSMNVLNPVRRIRHSFTDFAFRHMKADRNTFFDRVGAHLQRLKLDADLLDAYPHELSGGMRQRMTIALATILTPEFIIADEPTTALDVIVQRDVLQMIREIQREMGSSFLFVTHDMGVHAAVSDRIGIVYAGRLVEEAPTRKLFTCRFILIRSILSQACRGLVMPRRAPRSRAGRPILPCRRRDAVFIRAARSAWTFAAAKCRLW